MIKFILYEDNKNIMKKNHSIINKFMMRYNEDYRIYEFNKSNVELEKIIAEKEHIKIYLLDIEVESISGLDIARKIRGNDWNSNIIILTAHYELAFEAFKNRLLLLDFISKFNDYEKELLETLKIALNAANKKNVLTFFSERIRYQAKYENIIYITKEKGNRKTNIATTYAEFSTIKSLKEIEGMLDNRFIRINRNKIINKDYIEYYEKREKTLYLKDSKEIKFISNGKKLKEYSYNE